MSRGTVSESHWLGNRGCWGLTAFDPRHPTAPHHKSLSAVAGA
jgi:hypothetical protein